LEHSVIEGKRNLFEGVAPIQPMQGKGGRIINVPDHAIKFSSTYSYKGLESHVVIIIGLEKDDEYARKFYHTGISRAKSKLYVLKKNATYKPNSKS
jgi:superfamily I DNA/RNA helicase